MTVSSTNYLKVDKRRLSRVIILARLPRELRNKVADKTARKLFSLNRDLKILLEESTRTIWIDEHKHVVRAITPDIYFRDGDRTDLEVYLPDRKKDKTRAVLDLVRLVECEKDVLEKNHISHLISIVPGGNKTVWKEGRHPCNIMVHLPLQKVSVLLHDILLDIAMFHSFPNLSMNYVKTLENQEEFAKLKFQYAKQKNLNNYFGKLPENESGYLSFASLCRSTSGINFNNYIKLWNDFICSLAITDTEQHILDKSTKEIVEDIKNNHKYGKQFSLKKLEKEIDSLTSGTYALISTDVRPKRKTDRKKISALMGSPNWRNNRWRIKPFPEIHWYLRYCPFLAFYKFTKG